MADLAYPAPGIQPIMTAIDIVRSGEVQARKAELGKAVWLVHGMVSGTVYGETVWTTEPDVQTAMDQLAELYLQECPPAVATTARTIPWLMLIQWLLELLVNVS